MSRHLSLVHATSAGYCAVGLALYWAHSITFADSVARVRGATHERKRSRLTQPIPCCCQKLSQLFEIWWTRWDSNPRPPHCERGITKAKTRRHNQLAF